MKTVVAAAALSMCLAFAGHTAGLRSTAQLGPQAPGCIQHGLVHVSYAPDERATSLGCAQFLSTSRVVPVRRVQHT